MTAALGYAGILVALISALVLIVQGWRVLQQPELGRKALRYPVYGLVAGAVLAMAALEVALLGHDFSIEYVARNSSRATPLIFLIASAWAALEGSIVLWGLMLAGFTWWVWLRLQNQDRLGAGALAVMGLVAVFFFGLMATAANPFTTLEVAPPDGTGANPLLQNNLLMAVHPPLLYLGFVGLTVPFAFALSSLVLGAQTSEWLERTRRWTLVAWAFLTGGIVVGGLWAYAVLGWGGYWAWDPVENASFIPWLLATAFIHSSVVQRRRGMLQAWNIALIISTFAATILGTFLTRSGVISSVHSFTQSAVGPAFLGFLSVVLLGSFTLFALRAHTVSSAPRLDSLSSREGVFLFNNLLLTLFAFTVLAGTLYPILVEAFSGDQVSVGRPFFDRAAVPIAFALLLAMGLGPIAPYRVARPAVVWERIRNPVRAALVAGALTVLAGVRKASVILIVVFASFVISVIIRELWSQSRAASQGKGVARSALRVMRRNPGYWGGQLSHIGVALVAVAISVASAFGTKATIALSPGESASYDGYTLVYEEPFTRSEPQRLVSGAVVRVQRGDDTIAVLEPRLNQYPNMVQSIATPAVRIGLTEDLYLNLARLTDGGDITLDAFRFPLIWLLWIGGGIVAGGAAWSLLVRKPQRADLVAEKEAAGV